MQKNNRQEEPFLKEISLEDSVKANLVFKKFLQDSAYRELIARKFKYRYFADFDISVAISLAIKYYKKYGNVPEIDVLKSIIRKSLAKEEKLDANLVNASIETALNTTITDEELIKQSVVNFIASRTAYNLIIDNLEKIKSQKDVSYILRELNDIQSLKLDEDLGFLYFREFAEHLKEIASPEARMSTGYPELDKVLAGGWYTKGRMLFCFGGTTHSGKSLMLSNLAINSLKQGKCVLIVSLEMSELIYGSRIDAHIANLDVNQLQFNVEKLEKRVDSFKKLNPKAELIIKEFPANTITARDLDVYIDKLQRQINRKIDIIYLDYLTLMNPIYGKDRGMYERGGEIAKDVRALSYKYEVPIVSAVQLNRNTFLSEQPGLENVAESFSIAGTLDGLINLDQSPEDRTMGILPVVVAKNRLGGCIGEVLNFEINYSSLTISEPTMSAIKKSAVKKTVESLEADLEKDEELDNI